MMRNIVLHGRLKKEFGPSFRLDVETAAEAIRAIGLQVPAFIESLKEGSYQVIRGRRHGGMHLTLEDVSDFRLGGADLHIVPMVRGSKSGGGALKAILGVALIGASVFLSGGTLAAPIMGSGVTYGNLAMMGVALSLAGVGSLLSSPEETKSKDDDSFTLSGPGQSYEQGSPVPLIYGEVITGSVMISGGIDIEDIGAYQETPA
jgi:predicted phage tail protein